MKSLVESLFDSKTQTMESLFDKDLAKKELTIRDAYCLLAGYRGIKAGGVSITQMFNFNKLKKYPNPYYEDMLPGIGAYLVGVIVDLPVPSEKDYNKGINCDWGQKAVNALSKYVQRSWKHEFDERFEVVVRESPLGKDMIEINLELYDQGYDGTRNGYFQLTFKPN